jgi:hypothetical protein
MDPTSPTQVWLNRVRHDLVKRVLWSARDYRAMDQTPLPGGLITQCINDDGQLVSLLECWRALREEAPAELRLVEFERALKHSLDAATRNDLTGVLALEPAFERLLSQAK